MQEHVLSSLAEAQAVFQQHRREQKRRWPRKAPDAWITLAEKTLAVVVHDYDETNSSMVRICYEYGLGFECGGIHEITARPRNRTGNRKKKDPARRPGPVRKPLQQLHMFKAG